MAKKRLSLFALIVAVIMMFSVFCGCKIVTTNNDRDYNQVVATVNIGIDGAEDEVIYKRDMITAYINYGYYYSSNGYSAAETFNVIIKNLINNRIIIQYAMKTFEEDPASIKNTDFEKWDPQRYLTTENTMDGDKIVKLSETNEALYTAIKNMNDVIKGHMAEKEEKLSDTMIDTVRTVPTDAENDTTVSAQEKLDYINAGVDVGSDTEKDRRKAYNSFLKLLESSSLLGEEFQTTGDITKSVYYKNMLTNAFESQVITKYENTVKKAAREKVTFENLKKAYEELYAAQKAKYTASRTDFESALSSVSATSPILYSPYNGYGYVYNLLISATDEQKAELEKVKTTDKNAYATARRDIFDGITAKELRDTWLLSGYDFDSETGKFTGDYALLEDSLPFKGDYTLLAEKTDESNAEYRVDGVDTFSLDEFIALIENYLYGGSQDAKVVADTNPSVYRKVKTSRSENYEEKLNELLFAFSTDPGSLNTYKGYSITPTPDLDGSETYMQEFADAGREILAIYEADNNLDGTYMVVATDYGYHFMFFSQSLDTAKIDFPTLTDYLAYLGFNKTDVEWQEYIDEMIDGYDDFEDTDFYLYYLLNTYANADNILSEKKNSIINQYAGCVTKYESRYQDLLDL